jgi:hypothetical protein
MNTTIIITADLGHFKAYRISRDPEVKDSPKIELVESYDTIGAHGKASDKFSDSAGRFKRDKPDKGGVRAGYGEQHKIETENGKRLVKLAAENINVIIRNEGCARWHLAAAQKINNMLVDFIAPEVRARLSRNLKSDLTNMPKAEIMKRFE